eukprot:7378791-Prymnesium_polylepis.2
MMRSSRYCEGAQRAKAQNYTCKLSLKTTHLQHLVVLRRRELPMEGVDTNELLSAAAARGVLRDVLVRNLKGETVPVVRVVRDGLLEHLAAGADASRDVSLAWHEDKHVALTCSCQERHRHFHRNRAEDLCAATFPQLLYHLVGSTHLVGLVSASLKHVPALHVDREASAVQSQVWDIRGIATFQELFKLAGHASNGGARNDDTHVGLEDELLEQSEAEVNVLGALVRFVKDYHGITCVLP